MKLFTMYKIIFIKTLIKIFIPSFGWNCDFRCCEVDDGHVILSTHPYAQVLCDTPFSVIPMLKICCLNSRLLLITTSNFSACLFALQLATFTLYLPIWLPWLQDDGLNTSQPVSLVPGPKNGLRNGNKSNISTTKKDKDVHWPTHCEHLRRSKIVGELKMEMTT